MMFHHCNTAAPPIYLRATVLLFIHKKERLHTQHNKHCEQQYTMRDAVWYSTNSETTIRRERLLNLLISQCAAYLSIIVLLNSP